MQKVIKIVLVIVAILVILILLRSCGMGLGLGDGTGEDSGEGEGQRASVVQDEPNSSSKVEDEETPIKPEDDNISDLIVKTVTVHENEYIYDSETVELDYLMSELSGIKNVAVEIKDENASKNAYESLIEALNEKHIKFTEGN